MELTFCNATAYTPLWACRARFRVVAEAASEETAKELCDFCEAELKRLSAENKP